MAGKPGLMELKGLLAIGGLPDLGPGPRPGVLPHAALIAKLDSLLSQTSLPSVSHDLIRALILLWHDRLDPAHALAQGMDNPDGSFLHGIVHRREPDYANAKYWFRRTGRHAAFANIAQRAAWLLESKGERTLLNNIIPYGEWDPIVFIDLCERAVGNSTSNGRTKILKELQGIESEALLEHFMSS